LEGDLNIDGWESLKVLECSGSYPYYDDFPRITLNNLPELKVLFVINCGVYKLTINNCPNLQILYLCDYHSYGENEKTSYDCFNDLDFLDNLNPKNLTALVIFCDKISGNQDLSKFGKFNNLETLYLSGACFCGSLEPLKNLTKLK